MEKGSLPPWSTDQNRRNLVPQGIFLTTGKGRHSHPLISYELALRDAGLEGQNLLPVSSIYPPRCRQVSRLKGLSLLRPGEITFCVQARLSAQGGPEEKGLVAALALAIPRREEDFGYIFEHAGYSRDMASTEEQARRGAGALLASRLDPSFDLATGNPLSSPWKEKMELDSVAISTSTQKEVWTTVLALAVFLFFPDTSHLPS